MSQSIRPILSVRSRPAHSRVRQPSTRFRNADPASSGLPDAIQAVLESQRHSGAAARAGDVQLPSHAVGFVLQQAEALWATHVPRSLSNSDHTILTTYHRIVGQLP